MCGMRTDCSAACPGPMGGRTLEEDLSSTNIDDSPLLRVVRLTFLWFDSIYEFPYDHFLHNLLGRQPHVDLRIFGYDWRLSNSYAAKKLATFIAEEWQLDKPPSDENE